MPQPSPRFASLVLCSTLACSTAACTPETMVIDDAGAPDAGPVDAQPASTAHCEYEDLPPTAGAGGTVTSGIVSAGASERYISIPVSATLGAYTARSAGFGNQGFLDARRPPLAGNFSGSVGIELWPRVRAVAITTGAFSESDPAGDTTMIIIKADLGATYQGHLHELEDRLGPEFAGHILLATSHSHSSFANFDAHAALQVGFGRFARTAFDALLDDLEAVAREALANRRPARIGFSHDEGFDPDDRVNRDRRGENDDLAGGRRDDHDLYVIRLDGTDGLPIAVIPVFGMHGTVLDADNMMASGDAPAGLERVLEDHFDERVVVMHLQGAAGDVSPAGEGGTNCEGREFCQDFARVESIGWNARDELVAAWEAAGVDMLESTEIEMVTRSVRRGPDWRDFSIRGGELEYAPFIDGRYPDLVVWEDPATRFELRSPIDEFNAATGAALCGAALTIPGGRMPGSDADELEETPYASCNVLNERVGRVFNTVLDVDLGQFPLCDTTRTTVSAARIGGYLIVTMPGEPLTLLADRVREAMPLDTAHEIVVGYAQDHGGYMLTPEDWLRGGYEPNITFWGPLEGEAIAERAVELVPLVMTPEREDATTGGTNRVRVPPTEDGFSAQALPATFGAADASPSYLLTRALPEVPAPQPLDVRRLESAFFTWVGADPLWGTPVVTIERETAPGVFETVMRRSGRPVADGHTLLTWTPDPVFEYQINPATVHYWTVEWQAVNWIDVDSADPLQRLADRPGAPVGTYRFHVSGPPSDGGAPLYEITSDPFDVLPGAVSVIGTTAGTTATLDLGYQATTGYRLLDPTGSNVRFPLRGGTVTISIDGGAPTDVTVDATGHADVTVPASWTSMTITDRFGNTGAYTR